MQSIKQYKNLNNVLKRFKLSYIDLIVLYYAYDKSLLSSSFGAYSIVSDCSLSVNGVYVALDHLADTPNPKILPTDKKGQFKLTASGKRLVKQIETFLNELD